MRTDPAWSQHFLVDALGNTVALADSSGSVLTQYTYEPYGQATESGAAAPQSFQFSGRENDGTSLFYHRARYYCPATGRFISEDPIEFFGGFNLYAYAGNSPTNGTDRFGLWSPEGHDKLIDDALRPCGVPEDEIAAIKQGSRNVDDKTGLSGRHGNWHSMAMPGQTAEEAMSGRDEIVDMTLGLARRAHRSGLRIAAMGLLGGGLHPITDSSSPAHSYPNGDPQPWCGVLGCPGSDEDNVGRHTPPGDLWGDEKASDITPEITCLMNRAIRDAYMYVTGKKLSCKKE